MSTQWQPSPTSSSPASGAGGIDSLATTSHPESRSASYKTGPANPNAPGVTRAIHEVSEAYADHRAELADIGPQAQPQILDEREARRAGLRLSPRDLGKKQGRQGRVEALTAQEFDPKLPASVRGRLAHERRRVAQGRQTEAETPTPPGMVMAHGRTTPAREGFDYSNSRLQGEDLNKLEEGARRRMEAMKRRDGKAT